MNIISKQEFLDNKEFYKQKILSGAVFVYPTDTIYGIGCDATNDAAVARIRDIKERASNPFSVAVPSVDWIHDHCIVKEYAKKWISKLPGPYTLVLAQKDQGVCITIGTQTLGVRIPDNWMSEIVTELGIPLVSTSVNKAGKRYMTSVQTGDPLVLEQVDFIIDEGILSGTPSTIVHLVDEERIVSRNSPSSTQ